MHTLISSDGYNLRLTNSEYRQYKQEELLLWLKYYHIERETRGIFASNQNKYVNNIEKI